MRYAPASSMPTPLRAPIDLESDETVKTKLFERLKLNGKPLDPPELIREPVHIGLVDASMSTLLLLRSESKILQNFAQ